MSRETSVENVVLEKLLFGFFASLPISIAVAEPLGLLCALVWCWRLRHRAERQALLASPFFIPVFAVVIMALLVSCWGLRPMVSLGHVHRLFLFAVIFAVGSVFGNASGRVKALQKLIWAYILGACALAIYDVIRVPVQVSHGMAYFDTGNMRDPQMYLVAICFLLGFRGDEKTRLPKWVWCSAVVLIGIAMVLHFKRGVWLSFGVALAVLGLVGHRWKLVLGIILCAGCLLAVPLVHDRIAMVSEEFSLQQGGRYALWTRVAPALLKEYPAGMGFACMQHEDLLGHAEYIQPGLNHLHNNVLQIAVECGWAGGLIWVLLMVMTLGVLLQSYLRAEKTDPQLAGLALGALAGFSGLLFNGMVEYNFGDTEILMLFCALIGFSYALWLCTREFNRTKGSPQSRI